MATVPHPRRRSSDRWLPVFIPIMLALIIIVGVVSAVALRNSNRIDRVVKLATKQTQRLDSDALAQCRRVQREREHTNYISATVFLVLRLTGTDTRILPLPGGSAFKLSTLTAVSTWQPPTDCRDAVDKGISYISPRPQKLTISKAISLILDEKSRTEGEG